MPKQWAIATLKSIQRNHQLLVEQLKFYRLDAADWRVQHIHYAAMVLAESIARLVKLPPEEELESANVENSDAFAALARARAYLRETSSGSAGPDSADHAEPPASG